MNDTFSAIFLILIILVYLLPAFIAAQRQNTSAGLIFFVNLLLGWTFVFWMVALVWAAAGPTVEGEELRRLQLQALRKGQEDAMMAERERKL